MGRLGGEYKEVDAETTASAMGAAGGSSETKRVMRRKRFWEVAEGEIGVVKDLLRPFNLEALPLYQGRNVSNPNAPDSELDWWIRLFLAHTRQSKHYAIDYHIRRNAREDFRETPAYAYFHFIHNNQNELNLILDRGRAEWMKRTNGNLIHGEVDAQVKRDAIKQLIPDWEKLKTKPGSEWIAKELNAWADKYNLVDDWCMDFALDCLADLKTETVDNYQLSDDYVEKGNCWDFKYKWNNGSLWKRVRLYQNIEAIGKARDEVENLPVDKQRKLVFKYSWPISLGMSGDGMFEIRADYLPQFPGNDSAQFKKQVGEKFWDKLSTYLVENWSNCYERTETIADKIKSFDKKLNQFVTDANSALALRTSRSELASLNREADRYLLWLINFQFKKMDYVSIANRESADRQTVMRKVKEMASSIGFKLRNAHVGKAPGSRDNLPRGSRSNKCK